MHTYYVLPRGAEPFDYRSYTQNFEMRRAWALEIESGEKLVLFREMQTYDEPQKAGLEGLLIREIAPTDAGQAARLCEELGYPVAPEDMRERIAGLRNVPHHVVYVACMDETVIGWIDVGIVQHLQTERYGEIGGFVVSRNHRSRRIGQKLLVQAERWIIARGVTQVIVRSRISREAAHKFYVREGYSRTKTSAVFSKQLGRKQVNAANIGREDTICSERPN